MSNDALSDKRVVFINQDFEEESCTDWMRQILSFDIENDKPVVLIINSSGGETYSCLGLIDVIQNCRSPIYTVCIGAAFSCAANLLIMGTKRFASKNSTIMIHQIRTECFDGTTSELENQSKEMKRIQDKFAKMYLEKTKMDKKTFNKLNSKDSYMGAEKALELGIVDSIDFSINDLLTS